MQLVLQLKQALRLGDLNPGDRLTTAREVVAAVAADPNTVLKAYRELENDGLVQARPGLGTLTQSLVKPGTAERQALQDELVGLGRSDLEALVAVALDT
ncbi:GntR family transcriptional regulator [Rhodococcus sp. 27YEA15]|uniref:GntR family transcriptional regulator n=1 Tax=Rhodococcus sp. 27YEA15 TaxID=3156259 RepID=UPI003C7E689E